MNANILIVVFFLTFSISLKSQDITHRPSFVELETGMREELILLDTLIIEQIVSTLSSEGCVNLSYFLEEFQIAASYQKYPIGFNFAKFRGGFGDNLKKEICRTLALEGMCIDQIIENVFAEGNCYSDDSPLNCHPIARLIFNDKDKVVVTKVKERIATKGYRITYNPNNAVFAPFKEIIDLNWITLFSAQELESIDKEQKAYLRKITLQQD